MSVNRIEKVFVLTTSIVFLPYCINRLSVTAPFNNMRTLKFEAQPTNGFFAAVNQVFGGSS